ncbi:hypothetical protein BDV96DRAFT_589954 [Lophiotrema nucula]|uniref:Uncharacterized protein n=1 Tax=Lophiotrema nucula TaxID=690887 RepID=A0A6A5YLE2_9PLEO|nr:hypothetical protein BDV96DRAFT_589954 [Lophiotrema nucula]
MHGGKLVAHACFRVKRLTNNLQIHDVIDSGKSISSVTWEFCQLDATTGVLTRLVLSLPGARPNT